MLPNAERKDFWEKYRDLPVAAKPVPDRFLTALRDSLPDPAMPFSAQCRTAGTGSLGRPRFVALIEWRGGPVLREGDALGCVGAAVERVVTGGRVGDTVRIGERRF